MSTPTGRGSVSTQEKSPRFSNSVLLKLPKFSKDYAADDFINALDGFVEKSEIRVLGRLKYPNEWTMTLSCADARERMLQLGFFKVNGKKCVVHPQAENEIRGRIHWLPGELGDEKMMEILGRFGEVLSFKKEMVFRTPQELRSSVRSFSLLLKPDVKVDDIPHFITINNCEGLVTVKNRDPMCLGCRQHGHRKSACPNSAGKKFVSKKPPKKQSLLTSSADSSKEVKKKKKKKPKKTVQQQVESNQSGAASSDDVVNLEISINSFIQQVSETLNKLKINVASSSAAGTSSSNVQPATANQSNKPNVRKTVKKESGTTGIAVETSDVVKAGPSDQTVVKSEISAKDTKNIAVGAVNNQCASGSNSNVNNASAEGAVGGATDNAKDNVAARKKKNKKKKKKVQFTL